MAIQFIDNQPMRFLSAKFDDQGCINKDLSAYSVLNQPGDPVCVQVKQVCEGSISCPNTELSSEKLTDTDFSTACGVNWTCLNGWSIDTTAGQATLDTTVGPPLRELYQNFAGAVVGEQYQVQINVVSNDTGFGIDVYLGRNLAGTIPAGATGLQTLYGEMGNYVSELEIKINDDYSSPTSGTVVINMASVKQIAFCNQFVVTEREHLTNGSFTGSATGWTLGTGWVYAANAVTHTPGSDGALSQTVESIPHRRCINVDYTISGRTSGSISSFYAGELIASTAGNGAITNTIALNSLGDDVFEFMDTDGAVGTWDGTLDTVSMIEESSGWLFDPVSGFCHRTGWTNAFYSTEPLTVGVFYQITFQLTMSAGSVYVECGGVVLGTFTQSGVYSFTFTALTTDQYKFTPSSDFDGCIAPDIPICPLNNDIEFRLIHKDGTGATDWHTSSSSQDAVRYKDEYVTWCLESLASALSGNVPVALTYGCYYVQVQIPGGDIWTSDNLIDYRASWDCTKRIRAWCDGEALGFHFGDNGDFFLLVQRFRTLYMNPIYPNEGEDYEYSTGTTSRIFAKRKKLYELIFDYMDEYAHDTVSTMIMCDHMEIDAVEYFAPFKDYEPQWAERGKRNLAQASIEIQKRVESVIFNRNC